MDRQRISQILKEKHLYEVFYNEKPVWIQDFNDNIAKVGFLDGSTDKNVFIEDLYESNLYEK